MNRTLWAPHAWIDGRWAPSVELAIDADGCWASIKVGVAPTDAATRLDGPVIAGLVNAHSHAFQRAFAGLAERRETEHDDFWSWRDRMYQVALRIDPEQLRDIAAYLYLELLRGGYTHVCEFHYLHHAPDGQPYSDAGTMAWALAEAAAEVGIGLTLLPVLYERAGFDSPTLRPDQRRFQADADAVLLLQQAAHSRSIKAGVAIHSLRAATPGAIAQLLDGAAAGPVHIHVAEQTGEVEECLRASGLRPIEWLTRHCPLNARWHLVHATHATASEIRAAAAAHVGVVICPTTEANLGDGLADLPSWLDASARVSIGSDSHVCRSVLEELRLLEYGQRLGLRQRNVSAAPASQPATAARLLEAATHSSAAAAGFGHWGFTVGARADLLVIDRAGDAIVGVPREYLLDALVFAHAHNPWRDVMVGGQWVIQHGESKAAAKVTRRFAEAMRALWP